MGVRKETEKKTETAWDFKPRKEPFIVRLGKICEVFNRVVGYERLGNKERK